MDDHSSCITREITTDGGAPRTVVRFDEPLKKRSNGQKERFGPPQTSEEAELRMLKGYAALLERENRALLEDNENKARRINQLEQRLLEAKNASGK